MLYHGTILEGLRIIRANATSHTTGKQVAYFTEDKCYALVCCRSVDENFVTMSLREDGKQHYFERFPDQLKTLYGGKHGYLYMVEDLTGLQNTKGHTWESEADVAIQRCEAVADVYSEILKEEKAGNIIIHRYAEIDPAEQKLHANYIRDHIADEGEKMERFYRAHFSALWD